jgi:tol-pal system protein YbgF
MRASLERICQRATRRARGALIVALFTAVGCATPAELRKLQHRVTDLERSGGSGSESGRSRVADLAAEVEQLKQAVDGLNGRLEVIDRQVHGALEEARAARSEANAAGGAVPGALPDANAGTPGSGGGPVSQEVQSYRDAYAKWREGDAAGCVDLFGKFLQTYPASDHADDATYWLADCYFKQGNFSAAVLRFDDVARQYPSGDRAADALYRQGEALLRMGHGTAASNAFEKVLRDYPTSARAPEAKRQLDLLGAG